MQLERLPRHCRCATKSMGYSVVVICLVFGALERVSEAARLDYEDLYEEAITPRFPPFYYPHPGPREPAGPLGRTRLGHGVFQMLAGGRDAELRCDFPAHQLVSNVIWERVTDPTGRSFPSSAHHGDGGGHMRDYAFFAGNGYYGRTAVLQRAEGGSLFLRDVAPGDEGVYRCLASRSVPHSVGRWAHAVETIFQEVYFFPYGGGLSDLY